MAEWPIASDLKSEGPKGSVGSNPTFSSKTVRASLWGRNTLCSLCYSWDLPVNLSDVTDYGHHEGDKPSPNLGVWLNW